MSRGASERGHGEREQAFRDEWRHWPDRRLLEETFSLVLEIREHWPRVNEELFRVGGRLAVAEEAIVELRRGVRRSDRPSSDPPSRSGSGRHMLVQHEGRPHPVDASLYESIALHIETTQDARRWRGILGFGTSTFRGVLVIVLGAILVAVLSLKLGMHIGGP